MSKIKEPVKDMDFLTVKEASILLKISIKTLYRLIGRHEINALNFTERNTLIRRKDIDAYFDNNLRVIDKNRSYLEKEINPDNSYTMQEAQEKFKISNGALYNLIKKFKIPKRKQGRYTLVKKEHLDKILN
jgi:excisionase family DNA binding protein